MIPIAGRFPCIVPPTAQTKRDPHALRVSKLINNPNLSAFYGTSATDHAPLKNPTVATGVVNALLVLTL